MTKFNIYWDHSLVKSILHSIYKMKTMDIGELVHALQPLESHIKGANNKGWQHLSKTLFLFSLSHHYKVDLIIEVHVYPSYFIGYDQPPKYYGMDSSSIHKNYNIFNYFHI